MNTVIPGCGRVESILADFLAGQKWQVTLVAQTARRRFGKAKVFKRQTELASREK